MSRNDEFYIGYETAMPPGLARRVRAVVLLAIAIAASVAVTVTRTERPLAASSFDYGHQQHWTGFLILEPAPVLLVPSAGGYGWYWLVGRGKRGADAAIGGVRGGWVEVGGTQIARDGWRMIEVASVQQAVAAPPAPPLPAAPDEASRPITVRGEIVDSKCFLGVMNPGERIVHRDCAIRCLSGGVPPMLAYRDAQDRPALAVLVDAHGRLLHDSVLGFVGHPISATGRQFSINGQPVFQLASLSGVTR